MTDQPERPAQPDQPEQADRPDRPEPPPGPAGPVVPVGGGVPVDPVTGERFGYLPRKAAQRKIIVRRALGVPWILAALGAATLIAITGVVFFASRPDRPPEPYADAGPLPAYPAGQVTPLADGTGWVDRRAGLVVWLTAAAFCPADGGWVAEDLRWDAAGRPAGEATRGLRPARVRAANGRLYVDPRPLAPVVGSALTPLATCPSATPVQPRG